MADLLLELFSEEIPAIMQNKACEDLNNIVTNALVEAGLTYKSSKSISTPQYRFIKNYIPGPFTFILP